MARIQIIDDDPQVRETLKILLEQAGYFVEEAANGNDAVEQYRQQPADLVITDIHMPGKNGIELIQEIQQINPAAKVFVLSGGGDFLPNDKLYMLEVLQSVKAEFEKPLDTEKFLHSVQEILSNGNISSD